MLPRLPFLSSLSALVLLAQAAISVRADNADLPSPAEIQKLVDDQQYPAALRLLQRVLGLNGSAAAAYDRFDLLMLRAECQLQTRQQTQALDSLTLAKKEAFAHDKPDRAADPIALAFLLQRSHNFLYASTAANAPKPASILDRPGRGAVYRTLLADEFPAVAKRVALVNALTALPPLIEVARSAGTLRAVEYAAVRDDKQTSPFITTIAARAEQLLDSALLDASTRVNTIAHDAQNIVTELAPTYGGDHRPLLGTRTHRQGISRDAGAYLRDVLATCAKVTSAADELQQLLDTDSDALTAVKAKADTLKQQVQSLLNDDYSQIPVRPAQ